ncbi:hypothetical protein GKODMF_06285 [Candidatus Electrothrix gigas]
MKKQNCEQNYAILGATGYGHFLSHCNMLVFPALALPLSQHFDLDLASTLDLGFWMYLLFGITALPWGMLADTFGSKPLLALFYLGAGCSGLAAATCTDNPHAFQLALVGIGLFSGIYHPAGLGWIAVSIPKKTAKAMAINGIFGSLGLAMGPLLAGLINWLYGLEAVYLCSRSYEFCRAVLSCPNKKYCAREAKSFEPFFTACSTEAEELLCMERVSCSAGLYDAGWCGLPGRNSHPPCPV